MYALRVFITLDTKQNIPPEKIYLLLLDYFFCLPVESNGYRRH